jgi:hypothetical protein
VRVPHQLAPLVSDGIPERHVILDTEAHQERTDAGETQRLAVAVADFTRRNGKGELEGEQLAVYNDPAELWTAVAAFTRNRHRTIVWAHNLAYDLRISRALAELPALGLDLHGIVLEQMAAWAAFRGDNRTVLCCDLASWLPTSLAKIAQDLDREQLAVTHADLDAERLRERCEHDVGITREAVGQLLQLIRRQRMGPWRATGAGQSHAAWRRRWLTCRPFVHDSEHTLAAERRAMWTGRCEAWRHGRIRTGGVHEFDLQLAYADIAAGCEVPVALVGETSARHGWQVIEHMHTHAVLAEVDVTTAEPLVPAEHGELIHWPVGSFSTTLWDPELRLLYAHGARVKVRRCWLYQRGPALADFSRWLIDQLQSGAEGPSAVQRRALKHMSRTLVGRCALRYRSWEPYARLPEFGLRLGELHDLDTGESIETLHVGHGMLTLGEQAEAEDSLPQITGWVMAEARARLWRLMLIAGLEHVLYVDTDSVVVDDTGAGILAELIDVGQALTLRHKQSHRSAVILGPRQLQLGRQRRLAGVPLSAVETEPGVYEGTVWRSIRESVARGEGATVVLERKRWELAGVDNRREHVQGGATAPHRVG